MTWKKHLFKTRLLFVVVSAGFFFCFPKFFKLGTAVLMLSFATEANLSATNTLLMRREWSNWWNSAQLHSNKSTMKWEKLKWGKRREQKFFFVDKCQIFNSKCRQTWSAYNYWWWWIADQQWELKEGL
jgi:hypothetical protein